MKDALLDRYYFITIFLLGIIVYFPTFFNGFVWDDTTYILNNTQIHQLNFSIFFDNIFNSNYIYRQIPVLYYTILYTLFAANPFPYHLFGLLLHIATTFCIFLLFKHYFTKNISFILSIIFLIHPINAETVYWISSAQTQIYTIFGLMGLLLIMNNKLLSERNIRILLIYLFLSILSYEIGIGYFLLVLFYLYIKKSPQIKTIFLLQTLIIALYFFLRVINNSTNFNLYQGSELTRPNFTEILVTIPSIISYYINTLIYPHKLIIWQNWIVKDITLTNFIAPLIGIILFIFLTIWFYSFLKKKQKSIYLFFIFWFVLGFLPLLQIISLHMTVADRWFYFPFIGLLGLIGIVITKYKNIINKYKYLFLCFFIVVTCLYSIRTFYRGFDWKDNITLYTHDLQFEPNQIEINNNLAVLYLQSGNYSKAIPYLEKIASLSTQHKVAYIYLGQIYTKLGDNKKAIFYFKKALKETTLQRLTEGVDIYYLLAVSYEKNHNYTHITEEITEKIINSSPQRDDLLFIRANAYFQLHNYENAKKDLEQISNHIIDSKIINLEKKINEAF